MQFKVLTVSQPYASLIADGEKFVENRTWDVKYRGKLLIHAGKGTQYMTKSDLGNFANGAIVAVCDVLGCVHVPSIRDAYELAKNYPGWKPEQVRLICEHEHTEGPYGVILGNVVKLPTPVKCTGALGLWEPSMQVLRDVLLQLSE